MTHKWTIGRTVDGKKWIAANKDGWAEFDTHTAALKYVNEEIKESHIIRTLEELEALDAGTYLVDTGGEVMTAVAWIEVGDFPMDDTDMLAVVATEDHIRAARKALEEA